MDNNDLVSQLYEPPSPEDGFSEDELEGAEKRLGFRLPGLLREYSLLAGKREDINQAQNKLVHPNEDLLNVDRDYCSLDDE